MQCNTVRAATNDSFPDSSINRFFSVKCQRTVKYYNFFELVVISSNTLFCPTNCPKLKYMQFIIIHDREKLQNLTLEKLEPENIWCF